MSRGDLITYDNIIVQLGSKLHDLRNDIIKLGIIDNTITPVSSDADPRWTTYSANEVSSNGGYTSGGIALTGVTFSNTGVLTTFDDTGNINLDKNENGFTNAYWGILYNYTSTNKHALGFINLDGPISEVANAVNIKWGAFGIFTVIKP